MDSAVDAMLSVILSPATMTIVVVLGVSTLFISRALRKGEMQLRLLTSWSHGNSPEKKWVFGAYRVGEEVSNLVSGKPHRGEVLASRAAVDRQAMEASLLKAISTVGHDENVRVRARRAFEQYGFVAQHCACLLSASNAFDRTTSARILGVAKSNSALPFLFEGLYDQEATVRNQVILSLGKLGLPSAIGPILEAACLQQGMSNALMRQSLSFCSFADDDSQNHVSTTTGSPLREDD